MKTQDEELKAFLVDEMKSKENEYDLAKKLKLKHKTFENVIVSLTNQILFTFYISKIDFQDIMYYFISNKGDY